MAKGTGTGGRVNRTRPQQFQAASTLGEAGMYARTLGVETDYTSLLLPRGLPKNAFEAQRLTIANNISDMLTEMSNNGEVLPAKIKLVRDPNSPAVASYNSGVNTVEINTSHPRWIRAREDNSLIFRRPGFLSDASYVGTLRHETAHQIHWANYQAHVGARDWAFMSYLPSALRKKVLTGVSEYATENVAEFVAEVYSGVLGGKRYPKDIMAQYKVYRGPKFPSSVRL